MIYVEQQDQFAGLTPHAAPATPDNLSPSLSEIGSAAFGLNNDVVNAMDYLSRPTFARERDHNPLDIIKGSKYETNYLDNFVGSQSAAETRSIMSRLDREEQERGVMANSGVTGFLMSMGAGALSPTTLIPIGGWIARGATLAKAGRIALAAGEAGIATGAAVALQEGVLHTAQETRTTEESAWNIAGSIVLGGVLGGAGGMLSREAVEHIAKNVGEEFYPRPASAGAAATDAARGSGELKSTFGVAEAMRRMNPSLRTETSPFQSTRNTVRDLIKGDVLAENAEGIPSSVGGSVEAEVGASQGPMVDTWQQYRSLYSDYFFGKHVPFAPARASLSKLFGQSSRMSYDEFKRAVSDAALSGDVHPVPEVQRAAQLRRSTVVDPPRDEAMNTIPGFRERLEAGSADQSYLTRMWNRVAVKSGFTELRDILTDHFMDLQSARLDKADQSGIPGANVGEELTRQELRSMAEDVIGNIMGHSPGRIALPSEFNVGPRGPLKERALASLPTEKVLKFVERDIEKIDAAYTRTMATDIGLTKKFGSIDMAEPLRKIQDEANAAKEGKAETQQKKIQDAADADIRDLTAMRDIIRGTYKLPDSPDGLLHRGIAAGKTLNFLSSLGLMTVSSISDIGKPIMVHGLTRALGPALKGLMTGLRSPSIKLAARDVKLAGQGIDMITNDRVLSFMDMVDEYGQHSLFERGLQKSGRAFSWFTLMTPWNTVMKQWTGIVTQTRALQAVEKLAHGQNLAKKEVEFLAAGGVDKNLADRIAAQQAQHGGKDGSVWWAGLDTWTDREASKALRALVNREVDRIIVTPNAGDKPLVAHGDIGSVIAQFQTFAISSVQKTMLSGLAQRDMAVLNGLVLMLGLGAMSYWAKSAAGGYAVSDDPRVWASEAVDNSGVLGVLMNADHALEKLTDDRFGLSALTGQPARRYINVNKLGAFLGPSLGKASDILDVVSSVANIGREKADGTVRSMTASDVHKIRKMVPLQNLFIIRNGFDAMEAGARNAFGIPARNN